MDGHKRFSICTSIMPFFSWLLVILLQHQFPVSMGLDSLDPSSPKAGHPSHLATQRGPQAPLSSGQRPLCDWRRTVGLCSTGLLAEEVHAGSPGCTGHRCAALCFPRHSAHTYRHRRRGGALDVGCVHIGKPAKRCIHILVIVQSRQVFQVNIFSKDVT